jgi:hypothetical protein
MVVANENGGPRGTAAGWELPYTFSGTANGAR